VTLSLPRPGAQYDMLNEAATRQALQNADAQNVKRKQPIIGATDGGNAAAGEVGEYKESEVLIASAVSLVTATAKDITSLSLTPGDWDVWGVIDMNPAGTTTMSTVEGWISTTSATAPTKPNKGALFHYQQSFGAGLAQDFPVGRRRISIAATTTVYLSVKVSFAISTLSAYGLLAARRFR